LTVTTIFFQEKKKEFFLPENRNSNGFIKSWQRIHLYDKQEDGEGQTHSAYTSWNINQSIN